MQFSSTQLKGSESKGPEIAGPGGLAYAPNLEGVQLGTELCRFTDPESKTVYGDYRAAIQDGIERGLITICPHSGHQVTDDYAHFDQRNQLALTPQNSRSLNIIGYTIAELFRSKKDVHVLDLGAGSGAATSALNRLLPTATLSTVGLTPINPYLRIRPRTLTHAHSGAGDDRLFLERWYERTETPYITQQHIGLFPNGITLPSAAFHFIHDLFGPVHHYRSIQSNRHSLHEIASKLFDLLHPEGILYVAAAPSGLDYALNVAAAKSDPAARLVRISSDVISGLVFARTESPLWADLGCINGTTVDESEFLGWVLSDASGDDAETELESHGETLREDTASDSGLSVKSLMRKALARLRIWQ